jgi:GT2 family glycosyltransferase
MQNRQISIIIVSYNVRPFLINLLESVKRALSGLSHEIIIIDNASTDSSVQMLRARYPEIRLFANKQNRGFAAANNQGLAVAEGNYLVLINPDTLVQEDTFTTLLKFMDAHPSAGAATCKILNPDGSFSIDSRHSIPSPMTAFWKQIGFSRLFPHSHRFARYNLTFLNENEAHRVDALSGSFMFIRAAAVKEVGPLDEDYFMYCEDVDYCYRLGRAGWEIYYLPESPIIHYKGESTRKNDYRYVLHFNRSLYLFYTKHFHNKHYFFLKGFILAGVLIRAVLIYLKQVSSALFRSLRKQIQSFIRAGMAAGSGHRVLLVCPSGEIEPLIKRMEAGSEIHRQIAGIITSSENEVGQMIAGKRVVAALDGIAAFLKRNRVDEIIFSAQHISYKKIISSIQETEMRQKDCRIIPPGSDLIIGKGKVTEFSRT